MSYSVGIDLGTTQTAAAVRVGGRIEVVTLGGRRAEIPSLVFVGEDGGLLVGDAAERRGRGEPARLAREFKRRIGDPVPILVGGVPFSAHALTAKLLRHVLDAVIRLQDGTPATVAVTHPANWGPYKRELLDQAIRLADAGPVLLRTEPEAAALQHATARRIAPGETVAVYDLGGGTFDAAVLSRDGEGFVLLGEPEGVEQLGGADFDEAVFGHVLGTLGDAADRLDPDDPEVTTALARLRRDCVEAKESLSFDSEVMIPVALPGLHTRVRLNRSELEAMIAPSLEDTVAAMHRALRSAGVAPESLSAVLLAGGSSRIPLVAQLLSTAFGRPVVADPHPEHSIAMGAAVATAVASGDGSPFTGAIAPPVLPAGGDPAAGRMIGTPVSSPPGAFNGSPNSGAAAGPPANGTAARAAFTGPAGPERDQGPGPASTTAGHGQQAPSSGAPYSAAPGSGAPFAIPGPGTPASGAAPVSGGYGAPGQGGVAPVSGGAFAVPGGGGYGNPGPDHAGDTYAIPGAGNPVSGPGYGAPGQGGPVSGGGYGAPGRASGAGGFPPAGFRAPGAAGGRDRGGSTRLLVMICAILVAVLAGGTATAVVLFSNNDKNKKKDQAAAAPLVPSSAPSSPSGPAFPTDTMLVRSDTYSGQPEQRKSKIALLTPGSDERTTIVDNGDDYLPEWSHSRTQIAETRRVGDNGSIWVMKADGSNARKVVGGVPYVRATWSADDTKLVFVKVVNGVPQIFTVNIETLAQHRLTYSSATKDDPAWSPDGKSIAYWVRRNGVRQIYLLNVANPVEPGKQLTQGASGPAVDPAWSPDGKQIAYTRGTGDDTSDIWVMNADGSHARALSTDPSREMDPSFAPDGSWVAFTRGVLDRPKVVIVKVNGLQQQTLTPDNLYEGHPCWS